MNNFGNRIRGKGGGWGKENEVGVGPEVIGNILDAFAFEPVTRVHEIPFGNCCGDLSGA